MHCLYRKLLLSTILVIGLYPVASTDVYTQERQPQIHSPDTIPSALKSSLENGIKYQKILNWTGDRIQGAVILVDKDDNLLYLIYRKDEEAYRIRLRRVLGLVVSKSLAVDLGTYLSPYEVAVRVHRITGEKWRLHLVLVFQGFSEDLSEMDKYNLRVLKEVNGMIIENKIEKLGILNLRESFVGDITADGDPEFVLFGDSLVLAGSYRGQILRIWTVKSNGTLVRVNFRSKPLQRSDDDLFRKLEKFPGGVAAQSGIWGSLEGENIELFDKNNSGVFSIAVVSYERKARKDISWLVRDTYEWNTADKTYMRTRRTRQRQETKTYPPN